MGRDWRKEAFGRKNMAPRQDRPGLQAGERRKTTTAYAAPTHAPTAPATRPPVYIPPLHHAHRQIHELRSGRTGRAWTGRRKNAADMHHLFYHLPNSGGFGWTGTLQGGLRLVQLPFPFAGGGHLPQLQRERRRTRDGLDPPTAE